MSAWLLRGGRVIDPRNGVDQVRDVLLQDGKVAAVSPSPLHSADVRVVDVNGKWVVPGLIDLHVHLREPGEEGKETILTGCRAAVAGGFTSIVAMPNTKPVNDSILVTGLVQRRAQEAELCRVYPAGAISKGLLGEEMSEASELVAAGCVCLTDDGRPVMSAGLMRRVLLYTKRLNVPVMVHEEDLTLVGKGGLTEGAMSTRLGLHPVPKSAEVAMVARDLVLLEETGGHLHVAHVSCAASVGLIREAKRRGLRVTAEVAPHHFTLTDAAVEGYDTQAKMNPPLRHREDIEALIEGLADGTLEAIATDHAPHGAKDKDVPYAEAANGVVGLETALPLALALVRAGRLTPAQAVQRLSDGPARIMGLPGGHLAVGAPADVTVVNPEVEWTVDAARFRSKSRNTPFHGRQVRGWAEMTFVGGRRVFTRGSEEAG
jgi:dihydroorotase